MLDEWFRESVYQIVIHQKYLTSAQLEALSTKPMVLNSWAPMGSLA